MKPKSIHRSALLATIFATLNASGAVYQWNGSSSSDWATDSNWTGTAPNDANVSGTHRLNVNGATQLIHSADQGTSVFAADSATGGGRGLVIGSGASGSGTMEITGGSFSSFGSIGADIIGNQTNNTGILTINGGDFIGTAAGTSLGLGASPGSVSTLNILSGSATIATLTMNATTATVNLSGSGLLEVNNINRSGGTANINFDGGTLKARTSTTSFITGISNATVKAGGVTVDSNNLNITINPPLIEDPDSIGGGLTKNGAGLLTIGETNSITGPVDVNAGGLGVKVGLNSWTPSSFTHSGDTLNFNLGVYDSSNPAAIDTATLTVDSAITVNVTGSNLEVGQIPLIQYSTKDFTGGSLTLNTASLPISVVATLVDDNVGRIYLDVTAAPTSYVWSGDISTAGTGDWDTTSLNWNDFADAFSIAGTQVVTFPNIAVAVAGDSNTVSLTGDYSPVNISINNASGNPYSFEGTGKITGATTLSKSGTGIAIFNGAAHTYSGNVTINTGAIIKQAPDVTTGAITVANNATFALDGGITTGAGQTITLSGPGATGGNYFYASSAVQRGALQAQNGDNTYNGNVILTTTSNTRIGVQDGASLTIGGTITESAAGVAPTFRGGNFGDNITLNGACSWTGSTFIFSTGGSIILGGNDRLPIGSRVIFTGSAAVLDLNGYNQQVLGITNFNPTVTNEGTTPSILTLSPLAETSFGFFGVIIDGAETISVVKAGEGEIILAGLNSYTGTTTVNEGTLLINGDQGNATGAVQVNSATLGGTGTIGGEVTVASGGTVNPGTVGATGTLNVANSTSIAGIFACDVNAATTDLLAVTGDLTLTGSTLAINEINPATPGTYVIATYTGTRTGALGGTLPAGFSVNYDDINLTVELVVPAAAGYASWADANAGSQTADLDFDNDGVDNGVEYFMGETGSGFTTSPTSFANNTATWTNGGNIPSGDYGTQFWIQTSTNLVNWTDVLASDPNLENLSGTVSYTLTGSGKEFMRLKVTPN